ncbi:MAG: fructose-bisphosphate aldolase, partial [Actinomycetota bacterium]|nr:fructose-bisphosphate aldolase [Actinomycetota bacterium]
MWAARAGVAERAVEARHLRRVWALPATRLGVAGWPLGPRDRLHTHWNYWWQAHLLDCLIDAQSRFPTPAREKMISRLIRGIRLRNFGKWTNDYYDDIAWLGLALQRASDEVGIDVGDSVAQIVTQLR